MSNERLRNKTVFLSASVPHRPAWPESTSRECGAVIRSAVIAVTRRILYEGGTLVFGGHPSVSPFILSVAEDYLPALPGGKESAAPRIWIYQSEVFPRSVRPDATARLIERGAQLVETKPFPGEKFDPSSDKEQCLGSLAKMREEMFETTKPVAMIAIGGMEGILRECLAFRIKFPNRRIWALESTQGMAGQLRHPHAPNVKEFYYEKVKTEPKVINAMSAEEYVKIPAGKNGAELPYTLLAERVITATAEMSAVAEAK